MLTLDENSIGILREIVLFSTENKEQVFNFSFKPDVAIV